MNLGDVALVYLFAGIACGVAVFRRERPRGWRIAALSATATVPLWPLWAPFALTAERPRRPRTDGRPSSRDRPASVLRIESALDAAVQSVAGTPMAPMFTEEAAQRIAAEVAKVAERMAELDSVSAGEANDTSASATRLATLEAHAAPERVIATARQRHASLTRLEALRLRDAQALDELADLLEALRAQLLLARYAGPSEDGTGSLLGEVWARLQGLGAAFADDAPSTGSARA
jgi:hypothetical protein